ncbi:MAG: ABC transporter substrate-binding protein [Desulfamplus sp.]|nr:ABC transporter substrate-binding protein [Desulfamplus sp.]
MKKVTFKVFLVLFIFLSASSAICSELTLYTEESAKSHFTDKDGKLTGYVYEFVLAMQKKMGDTTPIEMVPWARGYHFATTQPNVAIFSTTFTEERRNLFKWVGPVSESIWVLYAKAGSGIKIKTLEDAKKFKSIGTYKDDVREQFLKEKGFTNLDSARDDKLNLKKLIANRIDLWASSLDRTPFIAQELGVPMNSIEPVLTMLEKGLFIAFSKDTPDKIVNKWAKAYDDLRSDGTMEAIYKKWDIPVPKYQIPNIDQVND